MKICDLHGCRFEDGKEKIIRELNECLIKRESAIQFIHGYHGHSFKDYIQSPEFITDMQAEGFFLTLVGTNSKNGVTDFRLENSLKIEDEPNHTSCTIKNHISNIPNGKKKMTLEIGRAHV